MNFTWHTLIKIVMIISTWTGPCRTTATPSDWREVEQLAEDFPYVVALLNIRNEYMCTGFSINERTVVTAGSCVEQPPRFVALTAVLGEDITGKNILEVLHTRRHSAYSYYVCETQPSETLMNSNIALVFVVKNVLDYFGNVAPIGDFSPLQLRNKKLTAIGYGELNTGAVVLQRQMYVQMTCVNPQWYYCVCGEEPWDESTYEHQFGEGGPVVLDGKVVAVSAAPCGALLMPDKEIKYNIFTVIMQYYTWITGKPDNLTSFRSVQDLTVTMNSSGTHIRDMFLTYIGILLVVINLIN